jgi:hypothetical protein
VTLGHEFSGIVEERENIASSGNGRLALVVGGTAEDSVEAVGKPVVENREYG